MVEEGKGGGLGCVGLDRVGWDRVEEGREGKTVRR